MSTTKDVEYECTLDEETLEKARRELGEKEETRLIEVQNLRKRIQKVPGLHARTDADFLLRFLRVRKFDQERAFQSVKYFYEVKKNHPEVFEDLKPSRVKHMFETDHIEILKNRNKDGCRVLLSRPAHWDEKRYSVMEQLKSFAVVLLKLQEEEENQVHGVHIVLNLQGIHWGQLMHWTPAIIKLGISIMQAMIPLRIKRIDYVHVPGIFYKIFPVIKQILREKLLQRLCINDDTFDGLHSMIDPDYLPTDCGGKLEPNSYKEWMDALMNSDQQFEDENKYGYVKMALETSNEDAILQGLGGTFKKLDV